MTLQREPRSSHEEGIASEDRQSRSAKTRKYGVDTVSCHDQEPRTASIVSASLARLSSRYPSPVQPSARPARILRTPLHLIERNLHDELGPHNGPCAKKGVRPDASKSHGDSRPRLPMPAARAIIAAVTVQ